MQVRLRYEIKEPYDRGLMTARGIDNHLDFLNPKATNLQSPFDLDNMEEAIELIDKHRESKILLVIDSDCDGYCSAAMVRQYFKEWNMTAVTHEAKGHGLDDIVEHTSLDDYDLVILPDAGSSDDEHFKNYPRVDFLVLDHHIRTNEENLPSNTVIVNNQTSNKYLNKSLSGGGVAWQFLRAYDEKKGKSEANHYIDLAAISIIGDVMDTTTLENRYIINKGLKQINNQFLKILIDNASFQLGGKELSPIGIAFYIVPNINAICRIGTQDEKIRMWEAFTEPTKQVDCFKRGVPKGTQVDVVIEAARESVNAKARQKRIQEKMAELCQKRIIEEDALRNKVIVITLDDTFDNMPSELNGLIATKIANDMSRPILIGRANEGGELKGSIRGLKTIDMPPLKQFLEGSGYFNFVQGHDNAAGFSLPIRNLQDFHRWANKELEEVDFNTSTWCVDFGFNALDDELKHAIEAMDKLGRLWGQGFEEALFFIEKIKINRSDIQIMGSKTDTIKVTCNGVSYMFFRQDMETVQKFAGVQSAKLNVVGTANLNKYYNKITPQIFVKDWTIEDTSIDF